MLGLFKHIVCCARIQEQSVMLPFIFRKRTIFCAPWKGTVVQWVQIPSGNFSLQPVAIGAVVEVTKRLKPPV